MPYREISLQRSSSRARESEGGDLIVDMALSSNEPYERWWGIEVLDHSAESIRLGRLNDGAALLFNHNPDDLRGTHVEGTIKPDGSVLRGKVRVTSATEQGRETILLVESGVLSKASIGYNIHRVIEQTTEKGKTVDREIDGSTFERAIAQYKESRDINGFRRALGAGVKGKDDPVTYRVIDWEPFESSLVTIPADSSVGVGRNEEREARGAKHQPAKTAETVEGSSMPKKPEATAGLDDAEKDDNTETRSAQPKISVNEPEPTIPKGNPSDLEKARKRAIENLCKANSLDEKYRDMWIGQGAPIEQVAEDILMILEERGKTNPQPKSKLGLNGQETQRFSFARAIQAIADKDWKNAGFELECSRSVAQKIGASPDPHKFYVPFEVMERPVEGRQRQQRDLTVGAAGAGGYLVATDNMGFIEMVRNRSVVFRMGARRLSGLTGSVTVPRQSAAATAYWLSTEATQATESEQTFVQMAMTPKSVGAYTEISRQLLLQSSPGAEGIVTDDLAQVVAIAADLGALEGSGASGQPTGISNTSGIGSVTGTSLAYSGALEFQTDVATANVMPMAGGYVTTPAVASLMMQRFTNATYGEKPLWDGNVWGGNMAGFAAMSTNQVTAATMVFGDWQELVIGEWGVLEVEVNPYANFQAGIIGVRAMYSMDVGVRRPFAFSRATSIT